MSSKFEAAGIKYVGVTAVRNEIARKRKFAKLWRALAATPFDLRKFCEHVLMSMVSR